MKHILAAFFAAFLFLIPAQGRTQIPPPQQLLNQCVDEAGIFQRNPGWYELGVVSEKYVETFTVLMLLQAGIPNDPEFTGANYVKLYISDKDQTKMAVQWYSKEGCALAYMTGPSDEILATFSKVRGKDI